MFNYMSMGQWPISFPYINVGYIAVLYNISFSLKIPIKLKALLYEAAIRPIPDARK